MVPELPHNMHLAGDAVVESVIAVKKGEPYYCPFEDQNYTALDTGYRYTLEGLEYANADGNKKRWVRERQLRKKYKRDDEAVEKMRDLFGYMLEPFVG